MGNTNQDEARHNEQGSKGLSPNQGEFLSTSDPKTASQGGMGDNDNKNKPR